jgi:catalase
MVASELGAADAERDVRSFALEFCTAEGRELDVNDCLNSS